jgi:hypothetical protein
MMNLIKKLFRTKPKDEAFNALESLFAKAMKEPSAREGFYLALLEAELCVSGRMRGPGLADLQYYDVEGEKILPAFSDERRLKKVLGMEAPVLKFKGRDLFANVAAGKAVALNPYSDFGREFSAPEILEILGKES